MSDTAGLDFDGLDPGDILDGLNVDVPADGSPAAVPERQCGWLDLDQQGRPRERSQGGRPTLYTVPRVLAILAALFDGANRAGAARRAGVGVSTFYVWLQLGRRGHPTFAPLADVVATVEESRRFDERRFWKAFRCEQWIE